MINTEERTLTASMCIAVYKLTQPYSYRGRADLRMHPSFVNRCFLNNEGIILRLTYFYFHRTVLKIIWKEKNVGYSKVTAAVLISHFRGLLIVIFRRIKYNEKYQIINCFLKLTLYWNSVLKFIFLLNTPKTWIFYILR